MVSACNFCQALAKAMVSACRALTNCQALAKAMVSACNFCQALAKAMGSACRALTNCQALAKGNGFHTHLQIVGLVKAMVSMCNHQLSGSS